MNRKPYSWKHHVKDYFVFSKAQRRATVVLFVLIFCNIIFPFIYSHFYYSKKHSLTGVDVEQVAEIKSDSTFNNSNNRDENTGFASYAEPAKLYDVIPHQLFFFDPNTATFDEWKRLGIRDKTIEIIFKYKSKGGKFFKAEDLEKIYGLGKNNAERLKPYVKIQKENPAFTNPSQVKNNITIGEKPVKKIIIDVNTADTVEWKKLPGIGSKLAARIVKYREALGGFYSVEQVAETYALPDSTFQLIKPGLKISPGYLKTRNINSATTDQLRMPYLPFNVANAIVQYRNHKGQFTSVNDLKNIPIIDDELFEKIAPYLVTE